MDALIVAKAVKLLDTSELDDSMDEDEFLLLCIKRKYSIPRPRCKNYMEIVLIHLQTIYLNNIFGK